MTAECVIARDEAISNGPRLLIHECGKHKSKKLPLQEIAGVFHLKTLDIDDDDDDDEYSI